MKLSKMTIPLYEEVQQMYMENSRRFDNVHVQVSCKLKRNV